MYVQINTKIYIILMEKTFTFSILVHICTMYFTNIQLYINRENKGIISTYIPIICISSIYLYLNLCSAVSVMIHNSVKTFFFFG